VIALQWIVEQLGRRRAKRRGEGTAQWVNDAGTMSNADRDEIARQERAEYERLERQWRDRADDASTG
jgi:hypothetical protein